MSLAEWDSSALLALRGHDGAYLVGFVARGLLVHYYVV